MELNEQQSQEAFQSRRPLQGSSELAAATPPAVPAAPLAAATTPVSTGVAQAPLQPQQAQLQLLAQAAAVWDLGEDPMALGGWEQAAGPGKATTMAHAEAEMPEAVPAGQRTTAVRRERNREAAARYCQRQRDQQVQLAAQLTAAHQELDVLLAEQQQLTSDQQALLRMEAVQQDLHRTILQVCDSNGPTLGAARSTAEALHSKDKNQQTQVVEAAEQEFAEELRAVVSADSQLAAAEAALRLLPPDVRHLLDASATTFVEQARNLQHKVHELVTATQQEAGGSGHGGAAATEQSSGGSAPPVPQATAQAVHHCALLRKLLIALALARPSPDKVMQLLATSAGAPPGTWQQAVERLRPTLTPKQLQLLSQARQDWLRTMGPLLARLGYQLSRPALQSWQAAFLALGAPAAQVQWEELLATPATVVAEAPGGSSSGPVAPPATSGSTAQGGQPYPTSMQQAGRDRQSMQRELRHLSDTFWRAWVCLVTFLLSVIQVMTLWQCAVLLATCHPHFPDLVTVAANLLEGPSQQQQQQAVVELETEGAGQE